MHGKIYIFGGITPNGYASTDIHIITLPDFNQAANQTEYQCIPALPSTESGEVPKRKANHTACAVGDVILIYGGRDEDGCVDGRVWAFDTRTLRWVAYSTGTPTARYGHSAVVHQGRLIIQGGLSEKGELLTDAWSYDAQSQPEWTELPSSPVSDQASSKDLKMMIAGETLYLLESGTAKIDTIHQLDISSNDAKWHTITLPSSPQHPIPAPRAGAAILPISTGHGRHYLLQFFGVEPLPEGSQSDEPNFLTNMWTLQLPSDSNSITKFKDATREKFNFESGEFLWAKVEVEARNHEIADEGKSLPGPLKDYAVSSVDRKSKLLWGGVDAKGQTNGDGWMIRFK